MPNTTTPRPPCARRRNDESAALANISRPELAVFKFTAELPCARAAAVHFPRITPMLPAAHCTEPTPRPTVPSSVWRTRRGFFAQKRCTPRPPVLGFHALDDDLAVMSSIFAKAIDVDEANAQFENEKEFSINVYAGQCPARHLSVSYVVVKEPALSYARLPKKIHLRAR